MPPGALSLTIHGIQSPANPLLEFRRRDLMAQMFLDQLFSLGQLPVEGRTRTTLRQMVPQGSFPTRGYLPIDQSREPFPSFSAIILFP